MNKHTIFKKLEKYLGLGRVLVDEKMSLHTNWKIGGLSDFWFEAKDQNELIKSISLARKLEIPFYILGGGTNVLVGDEVFHGLVIKNSTSGIKVMGVGGKIIKGERHDSHVMIEADSGVVFNRLVRFSLDEGLSNFESFLGQPGTVGGAIYINAHFMKTNQFVGDYVVSVKLLDQNNNIKEVPRNYLNFSYDYSKIQETHEIVLSATFYFRRSLKSEVWAKANESIIHRQNTQPAGFPTAGCTFRNISFSEAMNVVTPNNTRSAGYLIDQCGLKGMTIGGAQISEKHANFIVNKKDAKASDVIELINVCKKAVKEKFNVELKEEIIYKGTFE